MPGQQDPALGIDIDFQNAWEMVVTIAMINGDSSDNGPMELLFSNLLGAYASQKGWANLTLKRMVATRGQNRTLFFKRDI